MNNQVNLSTAFKLRNQIKVELNEKTSLLSDMPLSYEDGTKLDVASFGGKSAPEVMKEIDDIQDVLSEFNVRIAKANSQGPEGIIQKINGVNDTISRYTELLFRVQREPRETVEINSVSGVRTKRNRTQVIDINRLREAMKTLKKNKVKLENELSEFNGTTMVDLTALSERIENILS